MLQPPRITLLFASLHVLLFLLLTAQVVRRRRAAGIGLGSGKDPDLALKVRVHANFAEYVPLALLMLGLLETVGSAPALLWGCGAALLLARVAHAVGLASSAGSSLGRAVGATLTWLVMAVMAAAGLWRWSLEALL